MTRVLSSKVLIVFLIPVRASVKLMSIFITRSDPFLLNKVWAFSSSYGFDIEANGRNSRYNLPKFQFVQNRSLPCCIQSNHQYSHLLLPKHFIPNL